MKRLKKLKIPDKIQVRDRWFEGGTLHGSDLKEFHHSTFVNALATCSDWVATFKNLDGQLTESGEYRWKSSIQINSGDELLGYSLQLVNAITRGTEKHVSSLPDVKVTNIALIAAIQLEWIRTEPVSESVKSLSPEEQLKALVPGIEFQQSEPET